MKHHLISGLFAGSAILLLALLTRHTEVGFMIAPFGASAFLVFAFSESPVTRPRNILGGYLLSALIGVTAHWLLPDSDLMMALALALAVFTMLSLGVAHPPAAGVPILAYLTHASWSFVLAPVLAGAVIIALMGEGYRRMLTGTRDR